MIPNYIQIKSNKIENPLFLFTANEIKITDDEKLQTVSMVRKLLELSQISWDKGLLAMVEEVKVTQNELLIKIAEFILRESIEASIAMSNYREKVGSKELKEVNIFNFIRTEQTFKLIYNLVANSNLEGIELFEAILIMDAMLSIQIGMNTSMLRETLLTYYGIKLQDKVKELM